MFASSLTILTCAAGLVATPTSASAQPLTLEDLAAAQRASIEAEVRRGSAKPDAGTTAASPAVPAPAIAVIPGSSAGASGLLSTASSRTGPSRLQTPRMTIAGVAGSRDIWLVELTTDTGPVLLQAGDLVPGTPWRVVDVGPRAVRLERVNATRRGRVGPKTQRVLGPGDASPSGDD